MTRVCLYPLFAAALPVIGLFAANLGQVQLVQLCVPIFVTVGTVVVIFGLFSLTLRSQSKAALAATVIALTFFLYGHFANVAKIVSSQLPFITTRHTYLLPMWLICMTLALCFVIRFHRRLEQWTRPLNWGFLVALLLPLSNIGVYLLQQAMFSARSGPVIEMSQPPSPVNHLTLPNIYYVILDRYAGADILKSVYGFDNAGFLDFLRGKGFYIASDSHSNYLTTAHSLAASLNMEYLNNLKLTTASSNWLPLYNKLQKFRVLDSLRDFGYQYIHMGSWWYPTSRNRHADRNVNVHVMSEFSYLVYRTSLLYPADERYLHMFSEASIQCKRVPYKFNQLRNIESGNKPMFVFAHMLIPHPPFVFDRYGRCTNDRVNKVASSYTEQVAYVNKEIMRFIESVLGGAKRPVIIVLQADEGPYPERLEREFEGFDWRKATNEELQIKSRILNAYYFFDRRYGKLYSNISPVNSFRLILSQYFQREFDLLPDELYAHRNSRHIYDFRRVTLRVR